MKGEVKVNRTRVHSDWTLMQHYKVDDGTFRLFFADQKSDDQIVLNLEEDDIKTLLKSLAGSFRKDPEKLKDIIGVLS